MKEILAQLIRGTPLTFAQTQSAFTDIMEGIADPSQLASLLTLLAAREPTVEELHGAATVMRRLGCGGGRCAGGQAWEPQHHLALRVLGCAAGAGRQH